MATAIFKADDNLRAIIDHAKAAPKHRRAYGDTSKASAALMLVGDDGLYLMSNGDPIQPREEGSKKARVAYALGCDPAKDADYYDNKVDLFGGDDGVEHLPWCDTILEIMDDGYAEIAIGITAKGMTLKSRGKRKTPKENPMTKAAPKPAAKPLTGAEIGQLIAIAQGGGAPKRKRNRDAYVAAFEAAMIEAGHGAEWAPDILAASDYMAAVKMLEALNTAKAIAAGKPKTKAGGAPKPAAKPKAALKGDAPKPKVITRKALMEAAERGEIPAAPDFSAPSHKRWRGRLAETVALVEARDVKGLKAAEYPAYSSSCKAIARYRDAAVAAIEASTK